ncbi:preprotein translocase subunit SecE [Acidimicrobium ferrooxidans]|uniref:Protein translocase subunit SecE n=1 Tax=Acidimicrobium ferrooxidans TaxID=53635 RepID=A0ABS3AQ14_9ACTN|nr:preprotein translocase subunit SecE [Acidimicrobium ferrooxidans]
MAMNREQRRQLQKQGDMNEDGSPAAQRRAKTSQGPPTNERTSPAEFVGEVRGELRKVVWPTRDELRNYSIVVFITIVVLTSIIAGLDYLAGEGVLQLFETN